MAKDVDRLLVADVSDEELREVLRQRSFARVEARIERNQEITDLVHKSEDVRRFVRLLVSEHSRTSCSDSLVINVGRCTRCDVLNLIAGNDLADDASITFYVSRDSKED